MSRIAIPVLSYRPVNYVAVLKNAGAETFVLTTFESADSFDGLLLPGGGCDVNPSLYGQPNLGSQKVNDAEDDLQIKMLENFIHAGKPVLGVCRGMQLINVYFGGSLIQDIDGQDTHTGDGTADREHGALAKKDSWLARLYGEHFCVNSHHHQAVDRLGEGIEPNLLADDGILEGYVHRQYPIWAVQWHPERCGFAVAGRKECATQKHLQNLADGRLVYQFLLNQCKKRIRDKKSDAEAG